MKVGIGLRPTLYLPEAFAYKNYLQSIGWTVALESEHDLPKALDIYIYFLGTSSFLTQINKNANIIEVHDYASLSTPPLPKTKDFIKRWVNIQPS